MYYLFLLIFLAVLAYDCGGWIGSVGFISLILLIGYFDDILSLFRKKKDNYKLMVKKKVWKEPKQYRNDKPFHYEYEAKSKAKELLKYPDIEYIKVIKLDKVNGSEKIIRTYSN